MEKLVVQKQQILENIARLQAGYRLTDDSDVYPGYSKPTTPFRPYNDYCINLEDNPIENGDEHLTDLAEDSVIHKFINNLITNQALSLASNKEYHEEFDGRSAFTQGLDVDLELFHTKVSSLCFWLGPLKKKCSKSF